MTRFIRRNYGYLVIIFLSIAVSIVTLSSQSIRLDEAQSLWVSTKSIPSILSIDAEDVLVPLYEIILHIWLQVFGSSILAARSLSFMFFLITLPVLYRLAKETSSKRVAMVTVTLFSLSPFIMWYSSEARMYSLFALVTTWNHLFFVRFIRSEGASSKVGYIITAILGLYTHYFFIFLLATQVIYLLWCVFAKPTYELGAKDEIGEPRAKGFDVFFFHLGMLLFAGLFFLPWALYFLHAGAAANSQPLIPAPTSFNIFQAFINFLFGFQSSMIQSVLISLWPIFVLSFFFVFTKREQEAVESVNYFAFATFLPVVLIFIGSYFRPIFLSRYLILVTPTLFILIAWIFSGYHRKSAQRIFGVLFTLMFVLLVYQNISTTTPLKENYQGVSTYLEGQATSSDIIAVTAPFTIYPIEYTYQGNTKIETIPQWDRFSHGAIPAFNEQSMITQFNGYQKQYNHMFVVLSYDQGYESNIKKYLDTHFKQLTRKEFSPGLEMREYQLRYPSKK